MNELILVTCPHCSGSGEGMYEGSRCLECKGGGEVHTGKFVCPECDEPTENKEGACDKCLDKKEEENS